MAIQQKQPCETEYHLNQKKENNIYVDLVAKVERKSTAVENQFY